MAKQKQISNAKPRQDKTRKVRADRRKAFLDAAARRMGMLNWGKLQEWTRECVEGPMTDQGVNNRLRDMLLKLANGIPGGDPNIPPADMDRVREVYPVGGKSELSPKTMGRIQAGIEKFSDLDEAGRLAARPKASEVFSTLTIQRDSQERGSTHLDFDGGD